MFEQWNGFKSGNWQNAIDVRDFIQLNYTPYEGDESFLCGPTERTVAVNTRFSELLAKELSRGGVYSIDTETVTGLTAFGPGYIDKDNEIIVGIQTDKQVVRLGILLHHEVNIVGADEFYVVFGGKSSKFAIDFELINIDMLITLVTSLV